MTARICNNSIGAIVSSCRRVAIASLCCGVNLRPILRSSCSHWPAFCATMRIALRSCSSSDMSCAQGFDDEICRRQLSNQHFVPLYPCTACQLGLSCQLALLALLSTVSHHTLPASFNSRRTSPARLKFSRCCKAAACCSVPCTWRRMTSPASRLLHSPATGPGHTLAPH